MWLSPVSLLSSLLSSSLTSSLWSKCLFTFFLLKIPFIEPSYLFPRFHYSYGDTVLPFCLYWFLTMTFYIIHARGSYTLFNILFLASQYFPITISTLTEIRVFMIKSQHLIFIYLHCFSWFSGSFCWKILFFRLSPTSISSSSPFI